MSGGNGGPAFPGEKAMRFGQPNDCNEGMTLRDYFAAKAMAAMISCGETYAMPNERLATDAYELADAMIAARETN